MRDKLDELENRLKQLLLDFKILVREEIPPLDKIFEKTEKGLRIYMEGSHLNSEGMEIFTDCGLIEIFFVKQETKELFPKNLSGKIFDEIRNLEIEIKFIFPKETKERR